MAAIGYTTTAGADQVYELYIDADDLSGTDKYVNVVFEEVEDGPVDGHIVMMLVSPRFGRSIPGTVLT